MPSSHFLSRLVPVVLLLAPAVGLVLFVSHHPGWAQPPQVVDRPAPLTAAQPSHHLPLIAPPRPEVEASSPAALTPPVAVAPMPRGVLNAPAFAGTVVRQVHLPAGEKLIALTFDDGPWPLTTDEVLGILQQYNARATFFWVGKNLARYPQLAQRVVEAGHAVGDHTWSHRYAPVSPAAAAREIDSTAALIARDTEVSTRLFRPPGGNLKNGLTRYALSRGYTVVMWSVSSADTDPKAPWTAFADNVLKGARPGSIVLMHDGGGDRRRTVEALPVILAGLQRQGYRFVSVPELLAHAQVEPAEVSRKPLVAQAMHR